MSEEQQRGDGDAEEAEVVGVPPETPPGVKPSATGVVTGPLDEEPDTVVAEVRTD